MIKKEIESYNFSYDEVFRIRTKYNPKEIAKFLLHETELDFSDQIFFIRDFCVSFDSKNRNQSGVPFYDAFVAEGLLDFFSENIKSEDYNIVGSVINNAGRIGSDAVVPILESVIDKLINRKVFTLLYLTLFSMPSVDSRDNLFVKLQRINDQFSTIALARYSKSCSWLEGEYETIMKVKANRELFKGNFPDSDLFRNLLILENDIAKQESFSLDDFYLKAMDHFPLLKPFSV